MDLVKNALKFAVVGGIFYLLGCYLIHLAGQDYTSLSDWLFRFILVVFVLLPIVMHKGANNGYLNFLDGFKIGLATTVFLASFMAIGTWLYCDYLNSSYTEGYEEAYRELHYNRMMRQYIATTWKQDTITPGAIDTVKRGLNMNIEKYTYRLFTTGGQVQLAFGAALFWGILISLTVTIFGQKVKE